MIKTIKSGRTMIGNINGFSHSKDVWEQAVKDFKEKIKNETIYGFLEHGDPYKPKEKSDRSHIVKDFEMMDDFFYKFTLETTDYRAGKELERLLEAYELLNENEYNPQFKTNLHFNIKADDEQVVQEVEDIVTVNLIAQFNFPAQE